jgi:hypothetical protein
MTRTTRHLLLAAAMTFAASASAQDPVTRRPGAPCRPAAAPTPTDPAPAAPETVILRGHEDWGRTGS